MKQLMLGNEAVARGLYEAGVRLFPAILEPPVRKSRKTPPNIRSFPVNGRPTRR